MAGSPSKTERAAQIELGKLLEQAVAGRQPETDATVAQLADRYLKVTDWDLSARKANEGQVSACQSAYRPLQSRDVSRV